MAFSLASIQRNTPKSPRMLIHGMPGVGKTTFACSAPDPIVIQTEDGLGTLDVPAFPLATDYAQVMEALGSLYQEEHSFRTLVVDSLDWDHCSARRQGNDDHHDRAQRDQAHRGSHPAGV